MTAPTSMPPVLGLAEAAKACNISVSTLRRRKDVLLAAGAIVTPKGWQIPIPALVSLGYLGSTTPPSDTFQETPAAPASKPLADGPHATALVELESLRARLADAEQRAAVAEAVATERERVIQAQAATLRMIERGTPDTPAATPPESPSETPEDIPVAPPVKVPMAAPQGRPRRIWPFGSRRS